MAGITLAQAEAKLAEWLAADSVVSRGQSYSMSDGRSLTRANAAEIRNNIEFWDKKCNRLTGRSGLKVRGVTPV